MTTLLSMRNLRRPPSCFAGGGDGVGVIGFVGVDEGDAFGGGFAGCEFFARFVERGEVAIEIALADGFEPAERDVDLLGHF